MSIIEYARQLDGKQISIMVTVVVGISTIIEKIFKVEFIGNWTIKAFKNIFAFTKAPFHILEEVKEIKQQQLINFIKLESLENEIKYNGGKYTLKIVVGEIKLAVDSLVMAQKLSKATLRAALYVAQEPMYISDAQGKVTFINAAWMKMVDCNNPEEMMGYGYLRVIPMEFRQAIIEQAKLIQASPVPFSGEIIFENYKTKEHIKTYCRSTVVLDDKGVLVEQIGTLEVIK